MQPVIKHVIKPADRGLTVVMHSKAECVRLQAQEKIYEDGEGKALEVERIVNTVAW
jgi:hypothetical protein